MVLAKSVEWLEKSAKENHKGAQFNLAKAYEKGLGIPKNVKKAKYWYTESMLNNHPQAREALKRLKKSKKKS